MCIESLPRRPHTVTFDDALSALKLAPAAGGRGAVLDGWTDPIGAHDKKVLEVEQAMLEEKDLVSRHVVRQPVDRTLSCTLYQVLLYIHRPHVCRYFFLVKRSKLLRRNLNVRVQQYF